MADATLKTGWLMEQCHKARISTMLNNSPDRFITGAGCKAESASNDEAAELYAAMDARFKAWTGKSLRDHG